MWLLLLPFLGCHPGGISIGGDDTASIGHDSDETDDSSVYIPGESGGGETAETATEVPTPDVTVDCEGGGDFTTITAAIAASVSGTKIGLAPCTYTENIDFLGKSLEIYGLEGSAATILSGTGRDSVVTLESGESLGTRLAGVTIRNGNPSSYYGAGLYAKQVILTLEDVVFTENTEGYAVVYAEGSAIEATDLVFRDNSVARGGAVLMVDNGSFVAKRLSLSCENEDYAIYQHNSMLLLDSDVTCGSGNQYGVLVSGGELHTRRSRIVSGGTAVYAEDNADTRNERLWFYNSAFVGEDAGVYAHYMHVKARNSIFWGDRIGLDLQDAHVESYVENSVAIGSNCGIRTDGAAYQLGWNAVEEAGTSCRATGFGTVDAPPAFVAAPDNLHLAAGSLLIDAGDPDADREDADGSRNDIGMYGGPEGEGAL